MIPLNRRINCNKITKKFKDLFKREPDLDEDDEETLNEPEYRNWWTWQYVRDDFCGFSQSGLPNSLFSLTVLAMLVVAITRIDVKVPALRTVDVVYNLWYALVVASVAAAAARQYRGEPVTWSMRVGFLMDFVSYVHYLPLPNKIHIKIICYFIRVHRPLRFIRQSDRDTIYSSLLVTTLKYMYYSYILRIICAYCWIIFNKLEAYSLQPAIQPRMLLSVSLGRRDMDTPNTTEVRQDLFSALYLVNKIFIPIGPAQSPETDFDRVMFLFVMIIGMLMVTGAAVAALSSVISIHMRPEENFRTRYRIIMRDLTSSGIPISLRNKVETFYKMYWHKQRAVSATQLLPSFPPVLPKSVYTDIYFEATQKSGLLRDLSYQFLSEIAKYMETIFYIPGDCIIKRNSQKTSIIYITYGDIEMLTAEDDVSPMLRLTRGTVLTPWGGLAGGRSHVEIRAGSFCAARVLRARGLWRAAARHGGGGQTGIMMDTFRYHLAKVKRHYATRKSPPNQHKSSILEFKKDLMELKEARDANGELLLARPDYLLEIAGCYLMRNRADTTLTDDSDAICLRQTFPCILQPSSSLLTAWNWLVAMLIVSVCFTYPYYLIYRKTVSLDFRFFDLMVTVIYVLDIIVYLSTGTNVEEGVPITFSETSSKQVRSPWFVLDVLATVPIFTFIDEGQFAGINKLLRFPKIIRVIQSLDEECVYHTNVVRFVICSIMVLFACYFLAAVQQVFVCYGYGYCPVTNFTNEPFWTQGPRDDDTVIDRLCFSLYWAISVLTFTTHMELGGKLSEDYMVHLYTMLLLEVCIVLSICMEAVYSANIMVTTAFRESFDACVADARSFLIRHQMAPQLRRRFIDHLQLCWNTGKAYSMASKQTSVFYDLPSHVNQDILARQRSKYLLCIPFMKLLNKEDLKNISTHARIFYSAPNEIILNTGDISTEMYIIKQGFCEVLNPDTKEIVGTLVAKNHFGVLECLFRLPAFYTVRTTTHVRLFSISRKYFVQAMEVPQIKDAVNFAKEQEEYHRLLIRREPFVSYQPLPSVPNRERFKLPRKYEKDSAFLQPFKKFGFFSILRNIFPRFTFRPDSALLTRYEVCRASCAVAGACLFPNYTYLVLQYRWMYYATIILDLFAYLDIIVRMFIGYFDRKGILVYHPANTAAHYLRGAFFLDLFSCLPLEGLEVSRKFSYGKLYQVTAMKQVLMLNRLMQLYRLPGTLEVLTSLIERRDIILVLQMLPVFMAVLNVLTALLVFCSVRIYHSEDEREWALVPAGDKGGSWVYLFDTACDLMMRVAQDRSLWQSLGYVQQWTSFIRYDDDEEIWTPRAAITAILNVLTALLVFCSVRIYHSEDEREWALVPAGDKGGSWVYLFDTSYRFNVTSTPFRLHLGCYFWIVSEVTTTGYNVIAPTNLQIMGVLSWTMILGSLITTYMSVRIISLRSNVNKTLAEYQEHMRDLAQFMRREKLPKQLHREIMDHYELNWEKTDGIDARNVLKLCDQLTLRSDAILHLYGPAFANCPILADCDVSLLRVLGRAVRSIHFLKDTTIFQKDDVINHLYFVYSGQLQLRNCNWEEGVSTATKLGIGSVVGNLDNTSSARVSSTLVARTEAHLLQMKSTAFHSIVRDCDFPIVYHHIAKYRDDNELFINAEAARQWEPTSKPLEKKVIKHLNIMSSIVQIFFIITSLLCVYADVYNAGFQLNTAPILATLYILDVCFLVKILLHFTIPQLVTLPTHQYELDSERYIQSKEFKYDVASCVPIELFSVLSDDVWLALSILRLNRMLRAETVYKYLKRYQKRATENLAFSSVTLVMWFTVYVHFCTCAWFFIGLMVDREQPRRSWLYNDDGQSLCNHTYICSMYFALTTFAHNGVADIMPKMEVEVLYVSVLLIVSMMVYVVYVGEFTNIVHYASFRAFSYYSKFHELQDFLNNNRVSPVLIAFVNKYSVLLWREARGEQLPEFLVTAPLCLKLKVMSHAYKDVGAQHPVFKYCEPALLRQIVGYLKQYYYDENMDVVKQNEITNSMYLVHAGEVQEVNERYEEGAEGVIMRTYTAGQYFGVEEGLLRDKPFSYSYRTSIKSQILTLRLDDWEYLLEHFPVSKEVINNYQWSSRDDDDSEDAVLRDNTLFGDPDDFGTLGQPGGSEIGFRNLWGTSGGPSRPEPRKPKDGPNEPKDDMSKTDLRPSREVVRILSASDMDKSALADETKTEQEAKVKPKDDVNSKVSFLEDPAAIAKLEVEEHALLASSSTQLFERIRDAAKAVDENVKKNTDDTAPTIRKESTLPHYSVEEYLAHKFKMRDSYSYNYKREDDNDVDADVAISKSIQNRVNYVDRSDNPVHYRHLQLAESVSHLGHSRTVIAIVNLEKPLGEHTPDRSEQSLAPNDDLELRESLPSVDIPPDPVILERVESQEQTGPEQVTKSFSAEDREEAELAEDTTVSTLLALPAPPVKHDQQTIDRKESFTKPPAKLASDSSLKAVEPDNTNKQSTSKQPEQTSGTNKDRKQTIGPEVLLDFDSDVAARMRKTTAPTELPAILAPPTVEQDQTGSQEMIDVKKFKTQTPVEKTDDSQVSSSKVQPGGKSKELRSETQPTESPNVPGLDKDVTAPMTKRSSATLPALLPAPSSPEPPPLSEPPLLPSPGLLALPPIPEAPTTSFFEHTQLLQDKRVSQHAIVAPQDDQAKDLAGLTQAEALLDSAPTTSKATSEESDKTGPKETQSDQPSSQTESGKEKSDTPSASKEKPDQKKSDLDKASDDEKKEKKD